MSGVDNRIVTLKFENRQFEQEAKTSMSTLSKLKESLSFGSIATSAGKVLGGIGSMLGKLGKLTPFAPLVSGAEKAFSGIQRVLGGFSRFNPFSHSVDSLGEVQKAAQVAGGSAGMGVLEGGVTAVSNKFIALSTIAITTLSNITNRVLNATTSWVKSFTFSPVLDGLHEYELNLKSIQTIQANTDRPLPEITNALNQLNKYSDQTIYNFSEMARNVGTFTAAGVDLKTSVSSIKGIANLAALSGSSSEQAATAMYQLSQAIAAGKVGLMDWNSVVNAGMGGKKLQNALVQTAVAMGKINENQVKGVKSGEQLKIAGQSFRESIMAKPGEESWLSSDILVNTLATMDGRFSKAALSAEKTATGLQKYTDKQIEAKIATARTNLEQKNGVKYTDEQFAALQKMSTQAFKSATEVKTLGQVFDVAKETIGSGWSASFRNIFGNLDQAKKLFTGMSNTLNGIINQNALARNKVLNAWSTGGGRASMIDALHDAWQALLRLAKPIHNAFRDIFPAQTGKSLIDLTQRFESFMHSLIPSKQTMHDVFYIAKGVFAVFDIGKQIIGGVVDGFKALFGELGAGNGDFLDFAANIGKSIVDFDKFLKKSGLITSFFTTLGKILSVPLTLLKGFGAVVAALFGNFDISTADAVGNAVGNVGHHLSALGHIAAVIVGWMAKLGDVFYSIGKVIGHALAGVGTLIARAFSAENFSSTLDVINTSLLGAIVLLIRNFFKKGVSIDLTGGLFDGIKETLGEATSAFQTMQTSLKASIIMKLAVAIGVMALALLVLSSIDPKSLAKALGAMTAGFGILTGGIVVLMKALGTAGLVQLYVITSAMTKMAVSILLLSFALKTLAGIGFGDLMKGVIGLGAVLVVLAGGLFAMNLVSKGMGRTSAALIVLGVALNVLALAMKLFATISWDEMAHGLTAMAGGLGILVLAMKMMPKGIVLQAGAILILAGAMNVLAVALKIFATMSWTEMAKGLLVVAGALGAIALGMHLMPAGMALQAAALVAVAASFDILAVALEAFAHMSWKQIAKAMVTLAGAMVIIAFGLNMIGIVGTIGAAGLLATAGALAVLGPVLLAFGGMDWMNIIKSLTMLAGIFVVLGAAALLLAPSVPIILALGAAILLIGAGTALVGAGILLAATGISALVTAISLGSGIIVGAIGSILTELPKIATAAAESLIAFVQALADKGPQIQESFIKMINTMLDAIPKLMPKFKKAAHDFFFTMIETAKDVIPEIVTAGMQIGTSVLLGIAKNEGEMIDAGVKVIVNFLRGIGRNTQKIMDAGFGMIIDMMYGIGNSIEKHSDELGQAGADMAIAVAHGFKSGASTFGVSLIAEGVVSMYNAIPGPFKKLLQVNSPSKVMIPIGASVGEGVAVGIHNSKKQVEDATISMGGAAVGHMQSIMDQVSGAIAIDPNFNPTVTPVLDLTALSAEANKMSSILATAPIMPTVSYEAAANISRATQSGQGPNDGSDGPDDGGASGGITLKLTQELHSPAPIDSVESYKGGKSLLALAKEELSKL